MKDCCNSTKNSKICIRKDKKIFKLPRRFTMKKCKNPKGFTMKASCAPYKYCKYKGGKLKKKLKGVAVITPNKDKIEGIVYFIPYKDNLKIKYNIKGLTDGKHGFHIHEYGDLSEGCKSGCSHFNPDNKTHGGLNCKERHAGDLGNIISKNQISKGEFVCPDLSISPTSKYNIIGRMIIIHKDEDDLGRGGNKESLKTGNAGERIGCGVIGITKSSHKSC